MRRAVPCAPVSSSELVTARNCTKYQRISAFFLHLVWVAQCSFVHWHNRAAERRTRPWAGIGSVHPKTITSDALRFARHQQLVLHGYGLPGGEDGVERRCRFPGMTGPTPIFGWGRTGTCDCFA